MAKEGATYMAAVRLNAQQDRQERERAVWRQYLCAATAGGQLTMDQAMFIADKLLAAEVKKYGPIR